MRYDLDSEADYASTCDWFGSTLFRTAGSGAVRKYNFWHCASYYNHLKQTCQQCAVIVVLTNRRKRNSSVREIHFCVHFRMHLLQSVVQCKRQTRYKRSITHLPEVIVGLLRRVVTRTSLGAWKNHGFATLNSELRSWTDGLLSVCSASLGWLFCSRGFAPLIPWSLLWHRIFRCWFRVD